MSLRPSGTPGTTNAWLEPLTWLRPYALFLALAGMLASIAVVRGLFDPDYFWHLAVGEMILDTGAIPRADPFSFTWFGEPWIPDQWLAEAAIAAGVRALGAGTVLVYFGIVAAIGPSVIAAAAHRSGARAFPLTAVALVVAMTIMPQVTIRPQVISFALGGVLLALLMRARPETRHRLWVIPLLFLIWANVHGFFIVGLLVGLVYLAATLIGRTPMREHRILVLGVGLVSFLATLVTPSGPGGLVYAMRFGEPGDTGVQRIIEWQSPNFHNPQFVPFLLLLGLVLIADVRRAPGWMAVVALMGAVLGLYAARAVGLAAVLMMPALVTQLGGWRVSALRLRGEGGPQVVEFAMAAAVSLLLVGTSLVSSPVDVDRRRVPVEATAILRQQAPDAQVLAAYDWGGYVLNALHPTGGAVFVDGRMHMYQPKVMNDYISIVSAAPGWEAIADAYGVDVLLLAPETLLVNGAAQRAGWCEVYRDAVQVLLYRDCPTAGG